MDARLFAANNFEEITDLIGKRLHLGTSMFRRQISTESSAGRAEDCSVRSKFDSNP